MFVLSLSWQHRFCGDLLERPADLFWASHTKNDLLKPQKLMYYETCIKISEVISVNSY